MSGKAGILKHGKAEELKVQILRKKAELESLEKRLQEIEAER
jgi:hypothetical protein